jgi:hypothetical protein
MNYSLPFDERSRWLVLTIPANADIREDANGNPRPPRGFLVPRWWAGALHPAGG